MVTGSPIRARVVLTSRLTLLSVGALVMMLPFVYMLSTSLKPDRLVLEVPPRFFPSHATTANYVGAWSSNDFGRYFFNSVVVALATTVLTVLLASMMAKQLMLIDSLWGLIIFYAGANIALNTFLLRSFFQDIPVELEEAMVVDGAGPLTRFRRLILPLSRPALATVGIFTFLASWDEFTWALTTIADPNKRTLPIAIALFQGQHATSWGLVFAASMIAVLPVIAIFVIFQRQFISGLTSGAVKG
jgi:multiple sugar transport system permease protein